MLTLDYRNVLNQALAHSVEYLEKLDEASVSATVDLNHLRDRLSRPLAVEGADPVKVINELVADVEGGILGSQGGRFFGWVIGGSLPAALAADWLTATWDQNAALYACGPAEAVIEEICGKWLKDLLGLPETSSFALVTGCQMAHVTCLAAARNALLKKRGWNVELNGLVAAPEFRILCGQRHGSIDRAVRLLGFGSGQMSELPTNNKGRLEPTVLSEALRENQDSPTIVLLQAGDINTGGFDSFAELIPLAHDVDAWVHIDGAFGLWANASPKYRHLLKSVEQADSWATDGHKWLNVPYDCGYAFIANVTAHRESVSLTANYLTHDSDARDQINWNPEWSRRGRGVVTYAGIRQLGRQGIASLIERTSLHANTLVTRIGALPGAEVVEEAQINQGLVRFISDKPEASDGDHDIRTAEVIARILKSGEAFFTGTTWRGKHCMRVSVCNWRTSESDVERAIAAARSALGA